MSISYSLRLLKIFRKLPSPIVFVLIIFLALFYRLFNFKNHLFISGWHKKIDRGLSAQDSLRMASLEGKSQVLNLKLNSDLTEDIYPLA